MVLGHFRAPTFENPIFSHFNITNIYLFANSRAYKHWQRTLGQLVDHNNRTPSGFNNHEMSIRALTALSQTYFLKHSSDVLAMASAGSALSSFTICMRGDRSIALEVGRVTLGSRNERLLRLKISGRVYGVRRQSRRGNSPFRSL